MPNAQPGSVPYFFMDGLIRQSHGLDPFPPNQHFDRHTGMMTGPDAATGSTAFPSSTPSAPPPFQPQASSTPAPAFPGAPFGAGNAIGVERRALALANLRKRRAEGLP